MFKQIVVLIIAVFGFQRLTAQTYIIKDETQRINNVKYPGVSSLVNGDFDIVEDFWFDYIKEHGKVRRKRNYYQISDFVVKSWTNDTVTYATRIDAKDSLGLILLAPLGLDFSEDELKTMNADLSKILKLATRGYYVSRVQKRIDQSEDAAIVVSKSHQKLINDGENLVEDLQQAEDLKTELEIKLEETILKIKVLNQQIIDNKAATLQAYDDLEGVKKVIEGHKASLKKIKWAIY